MQLHGQMCLCLLGGVVYSHDNFHNAGMHDTWLNRDLHLYRLSVGGSRGYIKAPKMTLDT